VRLRVVVCTVPGTRRYLVSSSRKIADRRISAVAVGIVLVAAVVSLVIGIPRIASAVAAPDDSFDVGRLGIGDEIASPLLSPVTAEDKFGLAEAPNLAAQTGPVLQPSVKSARAPLPRPVAKPAAAKTTATRATAASPGSASTAGWSSARVSWYGPGFYGRRTANGTVLTPSSMVVAHRSLPFGTRIEFAYGGRTVVGVVADRGPFVGGRTFDLGPGVAQALGFGGVHTIQYRILSR